MFPDLDKDIIDDVVRVKQGRYANIDVYSPVVLWLTTLLSV